MNTTSATGRLRPVVGAALALGVALGVVTATTTAGPSGGAARQPAAVVSHPGSASSGPSAVECASARAVATDVEGVRAPSGTAASAHAAHGRAAAVARVTGSDDLREAAQNLADDLAAFRVTMTTTAGDPAEAGRRRADIDGLIRGDLAALRRLCGR